MFKIKGICLDLHLLGRCVLMLLHLPRDRFRNKKTGPMILSCMNMFIYICILYICVYYIYIYVSIHPRNLTCPIKRDYFNRKYIFQSLIFRGHASFPGSIHTVSTIAPLYWTTFQTIPCKSFEALKNQAALPIEQVNPSYLLNDKMKASPLLSPNSPGAFSMISS